MTPWPHTLNLPILGNETTIPSATLAKNQEDFLFSHFQFHLHQHVFS
jgi:hypothetical protein